MKGVGLGVVEVVRTEVLLAASFCCEARKSGSFSIEIFSWFALLLCVFVSVTTDPNNGDVSNENT